LADQEHDQNNSDYDLRQRDEKGLDLNENADYTEETSAELAAPISYDRNLDKADNDGDREIATAGRGVGFAALILSIISLFALPVLFGATGIILGFVARGRGARSLGSWAIGIGVVSIIVGMFILPFFR